MIDLRCGDCLEIMKDIQDKSIDLIVTDPPYQFRKEDNGGGGILTTRKYDKEIHENGFCDYFNRSNVYRVQRK